MKSKTLVLVSLVLTFVMVLGFVGCASPTTAEMCSNELTKVTTCLEYASEKAATPSKQCCESAKEIRDDKPVCLCFIIQQAHQNSPSVKSLGLKVNRLLQLPVDCKLANSSASDCPKLLGLSPSSPDYAIFTVSNASSSGANSSTRTTVTPHSGESVHASHIARGALLAVVVALLLSAISSPGY